MKAESRHFGIVQAAHACVLICRFILTAVCTFVQMQCLTVCVLLKCVRVCAGGNPGAVRDAAGHSGLRRPRIFDVRRETPAGEEMTPLSTLTQNQT